MPFEGAARMRCSSDNTATPQGHLVLEALLFRCNCNHRSSSNVFLQLREGGIDPILQFDFVRNLEFGPHLRSQIVDV